MHQRYTSTESLTSVFSQALSIISRSSNPGLDQRASSLDSDQPPGSRQKSPQPLRTRELSKEDEDYIKKEREARSIAIEKAYVHDVYEQISQHVSDSRYRAWPRVKQFLQDLEPGSLVCDVGCGSGKYLNINPLIFNIGSDRCQALTQVAREKDHEIVHCDNLSLPYRDETLDAVLSVAVIHHIATVERRVRALRELARILRVGGRVMISVWAMEQRHRKFESQDVLIPWRRPSPSSSDLNPNSSQPEPTLNSANSYDHSSTHLHLPTTFGQYSTTTTASEDDVTHYHAYTQTSDSSSMTDPHMTVGRSAMQLPPRSSYRRRGRGRHRGRSIDPDGDFPPYQSSSDLSSPNETCYSFLRRAIQKISTNKRPLRGPNEFGDPSHANLGRFPWFSLSGLEQLASLSGTTALPQDASPPGEGHFISRNDSGESGDSVGDVPIELRHLESDFYAENEGLYQAMQADDSNSFLYHGGELANNIMSMFGGIQSKSRSLDDLTANPPTNGPRCKPRLAKVGRANTFEDKSTLARQDTPNELLMAFEPVDFDSRSAERNGRDDDFDDLVGVPDDFKHHDVFREIRNSRNGSMRSLDMSLRSAGSVSSLSSGKSLKSNFSVQSDSALACQRPLVGSSSHSGVIPLGNPIGKIQFTMAKVQDPKVTKKLLGTRNWESDSNLDKKHALSGASARRPRARTISEQNDRGSRGVHQFPLGEKEKSKAMLSVECKLMKAIKEVNESDISETSTPLPSPLPQPLILTNKPNLEGGPKVTEAAIETESTPLLTEPRIRPHLVKQKHSFQFPDPGILNEGDESNQNPIVVVSHTEDDAVVPIHVFGRRDDTDTKGSSDLPSPSLNKRALSLGSEETRERKGVRKQSSLNDELLSRERFQANFEMRKKIQKQQSLPCEPGLKRQRSLKDSLMSALNKATQFEGLTAGWSLRSSSTQNGADEKTKPMTIKEEEVEENVPEKGENKRHEGLNRSTQPQTFTSSIGRIWQIWTRSGVEEGSFTHKRGVTIQPINVGPGVDGATRRSMFQRRRGGSSPISPKQYEALTKENVDNISPTLRRCCMDCPGGEILVVERERKLSKGEASDSSSKDGSIQSDTSLDSEDSCVSVIFVPHPDASKGVTGETELGEMVLKKQRSTSNSSESSDSMPSVGSGRGSPMSPSNRLGSPVKSNGKAGKASVTKMEIIRHGAGTFEGTTGKVFGRAFKDEGSHETIFFVSGGPLDVIVERHPESEADLTEDETTQKEDPCPALDSSALPVAEGISAANGASEPTEHPEESKPEFASLPRPARVRNGPKSFELEDIPDENPIRHHPTHLAMNPPKISGFHIGSHRRSPRKRRPKFDYPIVRHHPLFAKQSKSGERSNFSSLLMGENMRILRGSLCSGGSTSPNGTNSSSTDSSSSNERSEVYKTRSFEIYNPETDDLDSDLSDSEPSSSNDSNESVVSVITEETLKTRQSEQSLNNLPEEKLLDPPTVIITEVETIPFSDGSDTELEKIPSLISEEADPVTEADPLGSPMNSSEIAVIEDPPDEFSRRAEERRRILEVLFQENESVLTNISGSLRHSIAEIVISKEAQAQPCLEIPNCGKDSEAAATKQNAIAQSTLERQDSSSIGSPSPKSPIIIFSKSPIPSESSPPKVSLSPLKPVLIPPPQSRPRRRLDKARSVSPSTFHRQTKQIIMRQSSVPTKFDEADATPIAKIGLDTRKSPLGAGDSKFPRTDTQSDRKLTLAHLAVSPTASDGTIPSGSRESLTGSIDSFSSDKKSKSPSPSRSEASHGSTGTSGTSSPDGRKYESAGANSNTGAIPKTSQPAPARDADDMGPISSGLQIRRLTAPCPGSVSALSKRRKHPLEKSLSLISDDYDPELPSLEDLALTQSLIPQEPPLSGFSELGEPEFFVNKLSELDPRFDRGSAHSSGVGGGQSDNESLCGFPYRRLERKRPGREDSVDSSSTSAKSSIQYSDTSSMMSHRFSTISISSNVSSEVSFGNTSVVSGSSCYLASMSSADYDDRPALASSFSLSEADENEYLSQHPEEANGSGDPQAPIAPIPGRSPQEKSRMKALFRRNGPGTVAALKKPMKSTNELSDDETKIKKAEHLPRSRIGTETSVETSIENPNCISQSSFEEELFRGLSRDGDKSRGIDGGPGRASPSPDSSQESLHTNDGGSQTHHRFYHVFREGELDYLINKYVENLHIISSYYDHANWCVVAEKVNVWTI